MRSVLRLPRRCGKNMHGSWPSWGGAAAVAVAAVIALTGCGRMGSALSQQWIVVNFGPNTTLATVMHVRAACSHIQNAPPMALPARHSPVDIMYGVRFDTTNANPSEVAQLQECLQKFSSVQGLDPQDVGDEGS